MILRKFREEAGLKQFELADQLNMSPSVLCHIELGTRFPSPRTILKIMEFSKGRVSANDILRAWCETHEINWPGKD